MHSNFCWNFHLNHCFPKMKYSVYKFYFNIMIYIQKMGFYIIDIARLSYGHSKHSVVSSRCSDSPVKSSLQLHPAIWDYGVGSETAHKSTYPTET